MAENMAFLLFITVIFARLACGVVADGGQRVPAIFVFGDSLADVGNNNYLPGTTGKANFPHNGIDFPGGLPTGRFSNGYNGIDYLAMMLGFKQSPPPFLSLKNETQMLQGVNFASGGSGILDTTGTTITFTDQTISFENVTRAILEQKGKEATSLLLSKSLYLISTGSNDMFGYYSRFGPQNTTANQRFIASLLDKLEDHIKTLYKVGARKYGMWGLSRIGCVPYLRSRNPFEGCIEELNRMARRFNAAAKPRLHHLRSTLKGMEYSYGNIYDMVSIDLGFKELKDACCGSGKFNGASACTPNATYCPNREDHIFWDYYHPTQAASKLVALELYNGTFSTPINIKQLAETKALIALATSQQFISVITA